MATADSEPPSSEHTSSPSHIDPDDCYYPAKGPTTVGFFPFKPINFISHSYLVSLYGVENQ